MSETSALFDEGLQPERTALSWRRTGLAMTVASLAATRIMPEVLGVWSIVPAGGGIAVALGLLVGAHRRHLLVHRLLTSGRGDHVPLASGGLLLVTAATVCVGGLGALLVVIRLALAAAP